MADREQNVCEDRTSIEKIVRTVHSCANVPDAIDLGPCWRRPESADFMRAYGYRSNDIRALLAALRVEDYSHTSKKPDSADAYVFGVADALVDFTIYMKLQIIEGVVVLSFHQANRALEFPFRRDTKQ